jgi:hypothetical protein
MNWTKLRTEPDIMIKIKLSVIHLILKTRASKLKYLKTKKQRLRKCKYVGVLKHGKTKGMFGSSPWLAHQIFG